VESIQRGTGSRFSLLPPENATGNYVKVVQRIPVKIVFDPSDALSRHLLVPGMSVIPEVDITTPGLPEGEHKTTRHSAPSTPAAASNES
jgi:membrane fusion protein (multidrug efflux system)